MRKTIALVLCLCMLFCLMAGCSGSKLESYDADTGNAAAGTGDTAAPAETAAATIDIGKGGTGIKSYEPDTVVATVNGLDVTWQDYYYWMSYYVSYIMSVASQANASLTSWDAMDLSSTQTNTDVVLTNAQRNVILDYVILSMAGDEGVTLSEEDEAELTKIFETNADSVTGDGNGESSEEEIAAFEEYLTQVDINRDFYDFRNTTELLQEKLFKTLYGEAGADYPDEDAVTFAKDNGLMAAKHILLLTVDADTREPIEDEAVIAEKKATAEELLARLQAVQDDKEALAALFDELTAEYTEDTGYAAYPDGYVFSEGQMVSEFENAVKALEGDYELSDIVESSYGYHIIMSIPIDPDAVVGTTSGGQNVTLRYQAASQQFSARLNANIESAEVVWADGFETPDMAAIFG